jgi:hypothetical protein
LDEKQPSLAISHRVVFSHPLDDLIAMSLPITAEVRIKAAVSLRLENP